MFFVRRAPRYSRTASWSLGVALAACVVLLSRRGTAGEGGTSSKNTADNNDTTPKTTQSSSGSAVSVYFSDGSDSFAPDGPLTSEGNVKLKFPQLNGVHVRMWPPRKTARGVLECMEEDGPNRYWSDVLLSQLLAEAGLYDSADGGQQKNLIASIHGAGQLLLTVGDATLYPVAHSAESFDGAKASTLRTDVKDAVDARKNAAATPGTRKSDGDSFSQGKNKVVNRVYDFATTGADSEITLPTLQRDIFYCFRVEGYAADNKTLHKGYFFAHVDAPVTGDKWWADRYVMPSVGVGYPIWTFRGGNAQIDRSPSPFVFIAAHVTPWPTDRRLPFKDRVRVSGLEMIHIELGAAMTSPWPNVDADKILGFQAVLVGGGISFGDNILGISGSAIIGNAQIRDVDSNGVARTHDQILVAPTLNITTQADVVDVIVSITGGHK